MKRFIYLSPLFAGSLFAGDVTFYRDIAPIVYNNCTSCHREGENAPFPLTNYVEVSRKASTISRAIGTRYMPPWHADTEATHFLDVRTLDDGEIAKFDEWVANGKPEGDASEAPEMPEFTEGWQLGEPDLVLTMKDAFEVPADGPDIYRNFVLPIDLPEDKWIKAIELRPSARSVLHHSLFFLDDSGKARELDAKDGKPGFTGMGFRKSGDLGAYVPGVSPKFLPGDLARPLPKGSDLVLSTHFHPSGKPEKEQTKVGLYFADKAPERSLQFAQVPPAFGRGAGIDIPAGETNFTIEDTFTLPADIEPISVSGHAHYICESMTMTATHPDGTVETLLRIPDWDLDWQDTYFFAEKKLLPKGTVLKSVITYDNSSNNRDNPFDPPQRIKWGRESTDEMGSITLMGVAAVESDASKLSRASKIERVRTIAKIGAELRDTGVLDRLPGIVKSLDKNADGSLQESELPRRMREGLLLRLDQDGDKALNPSEIATLKNWLETLKGERGA